MTHETSPSVRRQVLIALLLVVVVALIAFLGSLATMPHTDSGWYEDASKVAWTPPDWLFSPVWTILYLFIAVVGFLLWRAGYRGPGKKNEASVPLGIFIVQLVLNGLWTPLFFAAYPAIGEIGWILAFIDIVALIAAVVILIIVAWRWSRTASILLVPYLLWLIYASTLNMGIIVLN